MNERTRKYLEDALQAVTLIGVFTRDVSFEDYVSDDLVKSAVERQFQVIGQVLGALSRHDAATATAIGELDEYVDLGQVLSLHHDGGIDHQHLWNTVESGLPALELVLRHLLEPR